MYWLISKIANPSVCRRLTPQTPRQRHAFLKDAVLDRNRLKLVQSHAHRHIGVLDHFGKLLEADLAVAVQVGFHDRFIDNLFWISNLSSPISLTCPKLVVPYLLQLLVLQVAPYHHLQHNEELAIAYVAIAIDVVDAERKP